MNDSELRDWVQVWAGQYPAVDDGVLAPLAGVQALNRQQLTTIVKWKIERRWQPGILKSLGKEPDERIANLSRRAFACDDDLGALLILQELRGIRAPLASAVLMTRDQNRYTVLDRWAVASLCWLRELPADTPTDSSVWLDYLDACRGVAVRTGESLRVVDRALYTGRGKPTPAPVVVPA